jgi:hypothetical protein
MFIKVNRVYGTELIPMIINTKDITAISKCEDDRSSAKTRIYLNTKNSRIESTINIIEDFDVFTYNLTTKLSEVPNAK